MNYFDLISILNNDDVFITGIAHHRAIDRRMGTTTPNIIKEIADFVSEIDGFERMSHEFAYFTSCYVFWQIFSKKYNNLIESHRNANPKRYPLS